ncbi:MAG TPA: TonB-dependent receptor [Polyangia bacterium]|nr:TonB-dependent receptor [Polyangia bacterium]
MSRRRWRSVAWALLLLLSVATPVAVWAAGRAPATVDARALTKLPKQRTTAPAAYPPRAETERIEADVTLLLSIDAEGRVTKVEVQQPAAPAGYGFDEAAVQAAEQFLFEPAEANGKPIAVRVPYVYHFRLPARAAASESTGPDAGPADGGTPSLAGDAGSPIGADFDAGPPATSSAPPDAGAAAAASAAPVTLSGDLMVRGTREPMSDVLVTVFVEGANGPLGFQSRTDPAGHFEFRGLAAGEWRVFIEAPGFYPYRTTETILPGMRTTVKYYMELGSQSPFDVTVTGQTARKEVNRVILPREIIDKVPGTIGDPLNVLPSLPGVARTPLAGGEIVVRGAAPEDTQVLVDGMDVPNIYHFGGLRSVLPIGILESIDFQPGNFNSYYGRAIGGIIDVRLKKLAPTHFGGYVDLSLLDAGLYLEAPIGSKGALAIAARRSYIDALLRSNDSDSSGVSLVTAPVYYDYQLLGNYRPAAGHDLRLAFFGSDDRLAELFTKPGDLALQATSARFSQQQSFYRGILSYRYVPTTRFENSAAVSIGRDTADFALGQVLFNVQTDTLQLRDTLRWKVAPWITPVVGIDSLTQRWNGLARLPALPKEGMPAANTDLSQLMETRLNSVVTWSPGWFGELELTPTERLFISAGVRADYFRRISQLTAAPRFIARYRLTPTVTAKGGAGLYYQEPQFDETDPNFGNPHLEAERALHLSLGAEWKPRPFLTFDGTGFYKHLTSMVSPTDATTTTASGVSEPLRYDNNGVGRVYGFELMIRHDFSNKLVAWLAYTLSRSERRDSGSSTYRLFDFDQTHILAAVATYQLPANYQIGMRYRYVTGTPQTPTVGATFDSITDRYDPIFGAPNSARTPAFHQLDLRVDKKWIHEKWTSTVYLDLQNVYNRANPEGLAYNYDYTKVAISQGLPVLMIVGFKADF